MQRRTGLGGMPAGLLRPTQPESLSTQHSALSTLSSRRGRKLYLSHALHVRLKLEALKRGVKISTVAEEILDGALPRWEIAQAG